MATKPNPFEGEITVKIEDGLVFWKSVNEINDIWYSMTPMEVVMTVDYLLQWRPLECPTRYIIKVLDSE